MKDIPLKRVFLQIVPGPVALPATTTLHSKPFDLESHFSRPGRWQAPEELHACGVWRCGGACLATRRAWKAALRGVLWYFPPTGDGVVQRGRAQRPATAWLFAAPRTGGWKLRGERGATELLQELKIGGTRCALRAVPAPAQREDTKRPTKRGSGSRRETGKWRTAQCGSR